MTIEEALYSYLKAHAGLSALVGTRIYPLILPQPTTLPAITYTKISRIGGRVLSGPNPNTISARFQLSCWANSYGAAKSAANQAKLALQDYTGTMGGVGGVEILDANPVNEQDLYETDTGIYHVPVDILILHL